jgi:rubredoxin
MEKINFVCPECKSSHGLEEIMYGVVQATSFEWIDRMDFAIDYTNYSTDGGTVDRFQCLACGYVLRNSFNTDICDAEELFNWLEEHDMIEKT